MTTATAPTPSNTPAPIRAFGPFARVVRRWLGITDQRHDFDALATTLAVKDQVVDGQRRDIEALGSLLRSAIDQLNRTTSGSVHTHARLAWYEARMPEIARQKKSFDAATKREQKRRERLIDDHPELSESAKQHIRATGALPAAMPPAGDPS